MDWNSDLNQISSPKIGALLLLMTVSEWEQIPLAMMKYLVESLLKKVEGLWKDYLLEIKYQIDTTHTILVLIP